MSIAGHADQAPRRRGRQSSRQERGPGSQAPPPAPPAPPAPPPAPAPTATAPVTTRRVRNRGPGALLRDERRRLGKIQPGIFAHVLANEVESRPALPHHALPPPPPLSLARREREGAPPLPTPVDPLEGATSGPLPPLPPPARSLAAWERAPSLHGPRPIVILGHRVIALPPPPIPLPPPPSPALTLDEREVSPEDTACTSEREGVTIPQLDGQQESPPPPPPPTPPPPDDPLATGAPAPPSCHNAPPCSDTCCSCCSDTCCSSCLTRPTAPVPDECELGDRGAWRRAGTHKCYVCWRQKNSDDSDPPNYVPNGNTAVKQREPML